LDAINLIANEWKMSKSVLMEAFVSSMSSLQVEMVEDLKEKVREG
jgi:hypothetical protein